MNKSAKITTQFSKSLNGVTFFYAIKKYMLDLKRGNSTSQNICKSRIN